MAQNPPETPPELCATGLHVSRRTMVTTAAVRTALVSQDFCRGVERVPIEPRRWFGAVDESADQLGLPPRKVLAHATHHLLPVVTFSIRAASAMASSSVRSSRAGG